MVFQPGDAPPFNDPAAIEYLGQNKGNFILQTTSLIIFNNLLIKNIAQNKGIYQVLYERGLYVVGMKGRQREKDKALYELRGIHFILFILGHIIKCISNHFLSCLGKMHLIIPPELDAHAVLGACADFKHESTALEKTVQSRGHILLLSPVCTPELAGGGIEYAWGKLKYEQRQRNETHDKLTGGRVQNSHGVFVR